MQLVTHSVELVGGRLLAGFRGLPPHLAYHKCIAGYRVVAPYVGFAVLVQIDLKCSVGVNCPHRAERVGPCADESSRAGCGSDCARAHQHYQSACENNSERVL